MNTTINVNISATKKTMQIDTVFINVVIRKDRETAANVFPLNRATEAMFNILYEYWKNIENSGIMIF